RGDLPDTDRRSGRHRAVLVGVEGVEEVFRRLIIEVWGRLAVDQQDRHLVPDADDDAADVIEVEGVALEASLHDIVAGAVEQMREGNRVLAVLHSLRRRTANLMQIEG